MGFASALVFKRASWWPNSKKIYRVCS